MVSLMCSQGEAQLWDVSWGHSVECTGRWMVG